MSGPDVLLIAAGLIVDAGSSLGRPLGQPTGPQGPSPSWMGAPARATRPEGPAKPPAAARAARARSTRGEGPATR